MLQQLSSEEPLCGGGDDIMSAPYHYSNHCSNICTVLQYLIRLPPFTQLFIVFQGQYQPTVSCLMCLLCSCTKTCKMCICAGIGTSCWTCAHLRHAVVTNGGSVCCYSDHHFDVPDRTFHSLQRCYQLVTMQSVTDTKELIPEFFYLPEFLENREGKCTAVT